MLLRVRIFFLILLTIIIVSCQSDEPPAPAPTAESEVVFITPTAVPTQPPPPTDTLEPAPTATTPPTGPAVTYTIPTEVQEAGFAAYQSAPVSIVPSVPAYDLSLTSLSNPAAATNLNPAQQEVLTKNGFVVVPTAAPQIYEIYQAANKQSQPIFVTTDAMLHTFHVLYDFALRDAEINHFFDALRTLTAEMLAQSQTQIAGTSEAAQQAALRNLAYFSVAASLLDPAFSPPAEVAELVAAELVLIEAHSGFQTSPIFGFSEDYSQYVPRGHYTRNETFAQYFRAMSWYGRLGFRLRPGPEPDEIEMGRRETRQAILIAATLGTSQVGDRPALAVWEGVYEPTSFFVGQADDLTIYDYLTLIRAVYGQSFDPQSLNDESTLDSFIDQAATLRPPRIIGGAVSDQQEASVVSQGFRFMGQRFVPDAYIFQQLVYDKVGSQTEPRVLPSALDVAGVLGSVRATDLSLNLYNQGQFENYEDQLAKVQREFAALPPEQWTANLYWGWLHTLQPLLSPPGEGYPTFMQNRAWADKELHTYLGSWAELKHDTILYAKQSNTVGVTSLQPEPVQVNGYVEPRPEVFARLAALVNQSQRGLAKRGLLNPEFSNKFILLEALLESLIQMAQKELANENLSPEEQNQIRTIGDVLEVITSVQDAELASATDGRLAIVADVHTDPNTDQVLEQGIGDAFTIWVIAPVDGQPTLTQGGIFSYYEFAWPLADRLTDEAWQALEPKPKQPVWTQSFVVP